MQGIYGMLIFFFLVFFLAVWEIMHHFMDTYIVNLTLNNFSNLREIMMKVLDTNSIKIDGIAKIKAAQWALFLLKNQIFVKTRQKTPPSLEILINL